MTDGRGVFFWLHDTPLLWGCGAPSLGWGTSLFEGIFPLNWPIRARLFLLARRPKYRRHHINKGWAWFEARSFLRNLVAMRQMKTKLRCLKPHWPCTIDFPIDARDRVNKREKPYANRFFKVREVQFYQVDDSASWLNRRKWTYQWLPVPARPIAKPDFIIFIIILSSVHSLLGHSIMTKHNTPQQEFNTKIKYLNRGMIILFFSFKIFQHTSHPVRIFVRRFVWIFLRLRRLQNDGKQKISPQNYCYNNTISSPSSPAHFFCQRQRFDHDCPLFFVHGDSLQIVLS